MFSLRPVLRPLAAAGTCPRTFFSTGILHPFVLPAPVFGSSLCKSAGAVVATAVPIRFIRRGPARPSSGEAPSISPTRGIDDFTKRDEKELEALNQQFNEMLADLDSDDEDDDDSRPARGGLGLVGKKDKEQQSSRERKEREKRDKANAPPGSSTNVVQQIQFRLGDLRGHTWERNTQGVRQRRVGATMRKYLLEVIHRDKVHPALIDSNMEIDRVDIGKGLRHAHVYWFSPSKADDKIIEAALVDCVGAIRAILAGRLNLRLAPYLLFVRTERHGRIADVEAVMDIAKQDVLAFEARMAEKERLEKEKNRKANANGDVNE
eukprot:m.134279 g.134279  ORF g.134279 m.134279 type:complete len:321 (+) comp14845_c0_seq2:208-1170(+)